MPGFFQHAAKHRKQDMTLSASELINAKEATTILLDHLGLGNYVFEVEPGEHGWEVHVECDLDGAWQTLAIPVEREQLLASRSGGPEREALLSDWRERLQGIDKH